MDWEEVLRNDDTECAWNKFKDILHSLVEKNVPLFSVNKKKVPNNPWITKATKRSISNRDKAWRKYREMKTESNIYKRLRNEANRRVKSDQAAYRKRILKSFKGNPKRFYGYMRRANAVKERVHQITTGNGLLTTSTDQETAQTLGDFFSSVFVRDSGSPEEVDANAMETDNLTIIIDRDIVMKKLMQLKVDKAQGPDDIHPAVLKNCASSVAWPLTIIFQKSMTEGVLPADWKLATVDKVDLQEGQQTGSQ